MTPELRAVYLELLRREEERQARDLAVRRQRAKESFRWFVEAAWPQVEARPFIGGRHIDVLCDWLQDYFDTGGGEDAVVNIPPGTGKSLICSVLWPAWIWAARDPGHRFLCLSYADAATRRDAIRCRNLLQSTWWLDTWPEIQIPYQNTHAAADWSTTAGGWRISVPLGGQITSRHADAIIIDDPIKPEDARLERAGLEDVWRIVGETLPMRRLSPAKSHQLLVMQRLHESDPSGRMLGKPGVRQLVLPMRFESEHPRRDPLDWRTEEGELLWPEGRTEADVQKLEAPPTSSYAVAGQLQQRPAPEGGGMFKLADFRYYKRLPDGAEKRGQWVMALDSKFKATTSGAYACITVWCKYEAKFYLVAVWRERAGVNATVAAMLQLSTAYPQCHTKIIEEAANGAAVCELLEGKLSGIKRVLPRGGKESRAHAMASYCETHDLMLPEGDPLTLTFKSEAEAFPNGATKDQIDAAAHAINHLCGSTTGSIVGGLQNLVEAVVRRAS